jgi:hypothetical protein
MIGLMLVALVQTAAVLAAGSADSPAAMAALWGGVALEFAVGIFVMATAVGLVHPWARHTWFLIGAASLCAALWDANWTYNLGAPLAANNGLLPALEIMLAVAFLTEMGACLAYAAHFRDRADLGVAIGLTLLVTVVIGFLTWLLVLRPALSESRLPSDQSIGYLVVAVGDLALSFVPMLFVTLTLATVRDPDGRRPDWLRIQSWSTAVVAAALMAISGVGWFYRLSVGPWAPGLLLDFFYLLGFVALATAVMLERDRDRAIAENIPTQV